MNFPIRIGLAETMAIPELIFDTSCRELLVGGGNSISVISASNQYVGGRKLIETTYSLAHTVKPATIGYSIIRRIESWSESLQNAFSKRRASNSKLSIHRQR